MNKMLMVSELSFILCGVKDFDWERIHFEIIPSTGVIGVSCEETPHKHNLWLSFGDSVQVDAYVTSVSGAYIPWELPADVSRRLHALMKDYHGEWKKGQEREKE